MAYLFELMTTQAARRGATRKWTPALEQIEQSESWLSQLATLPLEAGKAPVGELMTFDSRHKVFLGCSRGGVMHAFRYKNTK